MGALLARVGHEASRSIYRVRTREEVQVVRRAAVRSTVEVKSCTRTGRYSGLPLSFPTGETEGVQILTTCGALEPLRQERWRADCQSRAKEGLKLR
ncbi:hypothetical protein NDU88_007904 [Pleurodeles waltl]|uniref:Uncharacterized protein n=1 Tax=Pleurodeles waltl TaxID=8319 RepID=A0AAV7VR11_PLEWA|nr:hypothetical protein NDU88_007904 [Pleurodeles waltl]